MRNFRYIAGLGAVIFLLSNSANGQENRNPEIKLGLSSGAASIPPELRQVAQEGAMAIAQGRWDVARELYMQMVLLAPGNPLSYANLGVAEYQLKNYREAENNLKKSLDLDPSLSQNWTTLGLIQFEKGQLMLAISSLSRAIHEDPKSAQAHLYLAAVTYENGWTNAAIDELNKVVALEPDHREAHLNLALTYLGMKPPKLELVRRHYETAKRQGAAPHPGIERMLAK